MDLEFQKGFNLFDNIEINAENEKSVMFEPEWLQLNRQWTLDNPSILFQKCPRSFLDGWVTCENLSSKTSLFCNAESLDNKSKKCFIDKIDIKSLVDDPDSFNIDSLFAETDDHCSSCDLKTKKWDASDESRLIRFINTQEKFTYEVWKRIAQELGRTVNSVRLKAGQIKRNKNNKKPKLAGMIFNAIRALPEQQGTKQNIIDKIQELYENISLKR